MTSLAKLDHELGLELYLLFESDLEVENFACCPGRGHPLAESTIKNIFESIISSDPKKS